MKERIDILLVERRLVESRIKAQWLIKNGYVLVNKQQIINRPQYFHGAIPFFLNSWI